MIDVPQFLEDIIFWMDGFEFAMTTIYWLLFFTSDHVLRVTARGLCYDDGSCLFLCLGGRISSQLIPQMLDPNIGAPYDK